MLSKQTIYPFVVSMTGQEWDAVIENLNGSKTMSESMLSRLMKKCIVILNEDGSPRLFDPVAECVRFVSEPRAVASVECPSARENESDIFIFFAGNRHIIVTRYWDGSRVDFLLSEADETPLETVMQLAREVLAPGDCEERFLSIENLSEQIFDENMPFFRFTIQLSDVPDSQQVYAFFPRADGGAWLMRSSSQGARQGEANLMLAKLKKYLEIEFNCLKN